MLMITRRVGERVVIGNDVEIVVTSVSRKAVRLAVKVPSGLLVLRGEVHDTIEAANRAAVLSAADESELFGLKTESPASCAESVVSQEASEELGE